MKRTRIRMLRVVLTKVAYFHAEGRDLDAKGLGNGAATGIRNMASGIATGLEMAI